MFSGLVDITCGALQGSSLGLLLFLIHINDLPFSLQRSQVVMDADDTTLLHSSKNIVELSENSNRDLYNLKQCIAFGSTSPIWLQGNKLSLNLIKTQALVVRSRPNLKKISNKKEQSLTFAIDESQIEMFKKVKYLGVQLDQHLVREDHVRFVCAQVARALMFL